MMATRKSTAKKRPARKKSTTRKKKPARKKKATRKKTTARKKKTPRKKTPRKKIPARGTGGTKPAPGPATTPTTPQPGKPSSGPAGIRVRMYRVGFGDFFLLSVPGADGTQRHILIDCGVHAANLGSIGAAIDELQQDTGGQLALVIMTHRHADHISGFATGKDAFAKFTVERVWMSWFEDPGNPVAANFQASLTALATQLQLALAARNDPAMDQQRKMAENITGELDATGSAAGGSNAVALATLHGGFANKPPVDYYTAGDTPTLPDSLAKAGLTAQILGPPHDPALISQMNPGAGHQYLDESEGGGGAPARINSAFDVGASAYPPEAFELFSPAELAKQIASVQPDLMAAKATQADNTLNNQSLVVLFGFRGKTMLFAGDAQWGNWQNFLFGGALGTAGHTGLTSSAASILGNIDFYKVGHHGSTNATPIDALNAMRDGCVAMCSTQPGAYGSVKNNSEVPRGPLVDALEKKTEQQLARSDMIAVDGAPVDTTLPPLPAVFKPAPDGKLYIDYEM